MLVTIGDNCIDRYLPPIALDCVGGNAVNVAANIALRGSPSAYAGVVGNDAQGTRIIKTLQSVGVNVDWVTRADGATGLTEIQIQGGDYAIVLESYGVSDQLAITAPLLRYLGSHATRIHLTVTGRAAELIDELLDLSLPLSVDLGIVRCQHDVDRFEGFLPCVSEAFFSAGGATEDLPVVAALERTALLGAGVVIATRGARGCTALVDGTQVSMPSQLAAHEMVDPLGAGDAFVAGYLSALQGPTREVDTIERCLRTASTWAAQACQRVGGWPGAEQ